MNAHASARGRQGRDGGRAELVLRSLVDRFRTSLFGVPAIWIVGSVILAQVVTTIDQRAEDTDLPSFLDTTVDSARAVLGAVSSGTITAASIVFSLTLVAIQMSSSVYSSRVLRSFLRDRFQQHMIGIVMATFFYSLLVLRKVHGPLEEGGSAYVPRLSVFTAVVLALAALLALLASISHTAQSLRVSAVTRGLVTEFRGLIADRLQARQPDPTESHVPDSDAPAGVDVGTQAPGVVPAAPRSSPSAVDAGSETAGVGSVLVSDVSGWLQQISLQAIREAVPDSSTVRVEVAVGTYIMTGVPLLTLWPAPDPERADALERDLHGAFGIGAERTMHQDIAFGIMMLEDVAVKALSPGVNDPNTAKAVIVQLGEVVLEILGRELAPARFRIDDCVVLRPAEATYDDYVGAAFNQIRGYASDHPSVQLVLVRTLVTVGDELIRRGTADDAALDALCSMLLQVDVDIAPSESDPDARAAHELLSSVEWLPPDREISRP